MELWCSVYSHNGKLYSKGVINEEGENIVVDFLNCDFGYRMVFPCGDLEIESLGRVVGYILSYQHGDENEQHS